jgi:CDP-diacylglycerol--glycerol-3-phosphate 3-phosphatidyltransferase
MNLRNTVPVRFYYQLIEGYLLPRVVAWGLTANRLTLLGCALSALVPMAFWVHPLVGAVLILTSGLADTLDGLVARQQNHHTKFGAFLDSSLDRVSDTLYLMGFWTLFRRDLHFITATLLVFIAMGATWMISYVKARAESLSGSCQGGLMERGVRVVFLILWAILVGLGIGKTNQLLWIGLLIYTAFTIQTVVWRIQRIRETLPAV